MSEPTSFKWDGNAVRWMGLSSFQLPSDLFRYQEIICDRRPRWIIETGPGEGGTTRFLQDVCDQVGGGFVLGIRNSLADASEIKPLLKRGSLMAILDSDVYSRAHMQAELAVYAPLVTKGQFLVVCHTDREDWGARPALQDYMRGRTDFVEHLAPNPSLCSYFERMM